VIIIPPQHGQVSDGRTAGELATSASAVVWDSGEGTASSFRQWAILVARCPLGERKKPGLLGSERDI